MLPQIKQQDHANHVQFRFAGTVTVFAPTISHGDAAVIRRSIHNDGFQSFFHCWKNAFRHHKRRYTVNQHSPAQVFLLQFTKWIAELLIARDHACIVDQDVQFFGFRR